DATVQMDTVFGAANGDQGGGFMGKVMAAGKRVLTGESVFELLLLDCTGRAVTAPVAQTLCIAEQLRERPILDCIIT
ncbi:hypothetical protein RA265_30700, partial [Pseudomonas syringae pv. tagetis]